MSTKKTARIALGIICATVWGCSSATAPGPAVDGVYVLENVAGRGPESGTLILTRQGYAERRVRFRERNGALSKEYVAQGTAEVKADGTITMRLREMGLMSSEELWEPNAKLVDGNVEIHQLDADGSDIVERYRRK